MSERPYNFHEDFYVQPKKCKTETFVSGCRPSDANPEPQRSTFRHLTESQEPHVCSALIKIEFEKDDPFSDIDTKDIPPMQLSPSCFPTNVEVMSNGAATLVLDWENWSLSCQSRFLFLTLKKGFLQYMCLVGSNLFTLH